MIRCTILLFLVFAELPAFTQADRISFQATNMKECFRQEPAKPDYQFARNNSNEWQYLFSGLFLFYKYVFSSQDDNRCNFHPSCSEYGMLAIKKQGAILGMLATIDRLQRCNGLSPELYTIDIRKKLLIDPP
jgi:uncharacterized protein